MAPTPERKKKKKRGEEDPTGQQGENIHPQNFQ